MRFNPCCCCSAEAGIFVLLFFNLLYIAGLIVLSVTYSSWTLSTVIYESEPYESNDLSTSSSFHNLLKKNSTEYKIVIIIIWIAFLLYFGMEILLGLYLLKAVNTGDSDTGNKCRRWVKTRTILLISLIPFVVLHSYLHYHIWAVIVLSCATTYHIYYLILVQYYAHEIDVELNTSRMCNSMKCRVCLTYTRASKRPLTIHCDKA